MRRKVEAKRLMTSYTRMTQIKKITGNLSLSGEFWLPEVRGPTCDKVQSRAGNLGKGATYVELVQTLRLTNIVSCPKDVAGENAKHKINL